MMGLKSNIVALLVPLLLILMASFAKGQAIFDISKMGAKPDSDATLVLEKVWNEACASKGPSKMLIPKGEYIVTQANLLGPCKGPIELNLEGTLKHDAKHMEGEGMVVIRHVDQLTVTGTGVLDGQGKAGWAVNDCDKKKICTKLPMNIRFDFITNSLVKDITSLDSNNFQINALGCKNLTFQHLTIIAPEESPNTDGIHISSSDEVYVLDTKIATGDDCVSIGDKNTQIHITNVECGPGHGISIGSLGKYSKEQALAGIFVKNCILKGTDNGVRIKTWPNSPVAFIASDMHFEDIEMDNVKNPIIIDQEYCPNDQCDKKVPSKIQLSNVSFKNIKGTSASPVAVKVVCSKSRPCENVEFVDINLTYNGKEGSIKSECLNVKPTMTGINNPKICTEIAPSLLQV